MRAIIEGRDPASADNFGATSDGTLPSSLQEKPVPDAAENRDGSFPEEAFGDDGDAEDRV